MAKARLTMKTTARVRFRRPQQQKVQRGASEPPSSPLPTVCGNCTGPVRLGVLSVFVRPNRVPGRLRLASRAVMETEGGRRWVAEPPKTVLPWTPWPGLEDPSAWMEREGDVMIM